MGDRVESAADLPIIVVTTVTTLTTAAATRYTATSRVTALARRSQGQTEHAQRLASVWSDATIVEVQQQPKQFLSPGRPGGRPAASVAAAGIGAPAGSSGHPIPDRGSVPTRQLPRGHLCLSSHRLRLDGHRGRPRVGQQVVPAQPTVLDFVPVRRYQIPLDVPLQRGIQRARPRPYRAGGQRLELGKEWVSVPGLMGKGGQDQEWLFLSASMSAVYRGAAYAPSCAEAAEPVNQAHGTAPTDRAAPRREGSTASLDRPVHSGPRHRGRREGSHCPL
jgi:hypothetical protein